MQPGLLLVEQVALYVNRSWHSPFGKSSTLVVRTARFCFSCEPLGMWGHTKQPGKSLSPGTYSSAFDSIPGDRQRCAESQKRTTAGVPHTLAWRVTWSRRAPANWKGAGTHHRADHDHLLFVLCCFDLCHLLQAQRFDGLLAQNEL